MSGAENRQAADKVVRLKRKNRKCPTCGRPAVEGTRPFCSKRCADIDLGRWLGEDYRIAGEAAPSEVEGDEGDGPWRL